VQHERQQDERRERSAQEDDHRRGEVAQPDLDEEVRGTPERGEDEQL
jgi:hypothetical protein